MDIRLAPRQDPPPRQCKHGVGAADRCCSLCKGLPELGATKQADWYESARQFSPYRLTKGLRMLAQDEVSREPATVHLLDTPFSELAETF